MPSVTDQRDRRLDALREIIASEQARTQADLVTHLGARGFSVTQASVSRDLRDLRVSKQSGVYQLVTEEARPAANRLREGLAQAVREVRPAGPHLLVLHTQVGVASRVALALDQSGWTEVVGTVAGDDTVFVATPGVSEQRRLTFRLDSLQEG